MIIVLLGYMGSGKSAVGQLLAKKLNCSFLDLDEVISEREGFTIPEIFSSKGEIYFRKKETQYLNDLLGREGHLVLSLGGGTPCYGSNMNDISKSGAKSFYLRTSIPVLFERLKLEKDSRPLISHLASDQELMEFIGKHLFERQSFYNQADFVVSTDKNTISEITEEIRQLAMA